MVSYLKALQLIDASAEMKLACSACTFYTVAYQVVNGYHIGSMDGQEGSPALPLLYATKEEAIKENLDEQFQGDVVKVRWDGQSSSMSLFKDGQLLIESDWKSLSGL